MAMATTTATDLRLHNAAHLAARQQVVTFTLGCVQWPLGDAARLADWLADNGCSDQANQIRKLIEVQESCHE